MRLIAIALQKVKQAWQQDKKLLESPAWEKRIALLVSSGIAKNDQPLLIIIDDFSAKAA